MIIFVNNSFEGCFCGLVVANDILFILLYIYSLLLMCSKARLFLCSEGFLEGMYNCLWNSPSCSSSV